MKPIIEVGIDVSKWQGVPNWKSVVGDAQHIKFVFCKATQGTTVTDPQFDSNCKGANAVGLEVGAYHFMDGSDPVAQANHFVAVVKPELLKRELVLDLESNPANLSNAQLTDAAVKFFNRVIALTGRAKNELAIYTNKNYLTKLDMTKLAGINIWIAAYGVADPGVANAEYWQKSEAGHVAGINGYVDIDVEFAPSQVKTGTTTKAPVYHPTTYTVVSGDTLSEIATAHKTTVAAIKSLNGLSTDTIYIGQSLKLPKSKSVTSKVTTSTVKYKVVSGDTLSEIAAKYKTTVSKLKSLNGLHSDLIKIGQILRVK